jgi:hypothetical protein
MRRPLACAVAMLWLLIGAASTAAAPEGPSVTGGGQGASPLPTEPGNTVQLSVDAKQLPDGSFQGRFTALNHPADGSRSGVVQGDVNCFTVIGNTTNITGVATSGFVPGLGNPAGQGIAITIVDNDGFGPDLFSIEVQFAPVPHPIFPCQPAHSPPAVAEEGNFIIHS